MNAKDVLFKTDRFNLSEVKPHFINPCCFGEDLAAWMKAKLIERNALVRQEPAQEDWGWHFRAQYQGARYWLGFGGNSDGDATDPNRGEWRVFVNKERSFLERLTG